MALAVVQDLNASAGAWNTPPVAGNLLLLVANSAPTNDSAYTQIDGTGTSCGAWQKIAAGGDVFPKVVGNVDAILEISGQSASAPINAVGTTSATSTVANCLAVAMASQGGTVQPGWTPETTANRYTATQQLAAAGTTASGAWASSTGTNYQGVVIVAPASTSGGALAGAVTLALGATGTVGAMGALAGSTALALNATGTVAATGALVGTAALVLGATGTAAATGALAGATALSLAATGTASGAGKGALAGAAALALGAAGSIAGAGALTGATALTLGAAGAVAGSGALAASTALAFAASGTLSNASAGAMRGVTSLALAASGALRGIGALSGAVALALGATGKLTPSGSLAADPRYYIALPSRTFYVQLAPRTFYVAGDTMQAFPLKNPDETFVLTFDATPDLANGETLAEITGTVVTLAYGTDPDPSDILATPIINAAAVTIPGKIITVAAKCGVQVVASGGFLSTGYQIAITCTTSNPDKILTLTGMLPVGIG